jgi:hypothetical protein
LDRLIDIEAFKQKHLAERTPEQDEETELMRMCAARDKAALEHGLDDIRMKVKALQQGADNSANRIRQMTAQKELTVLQRDLREKEERLFFDCMKLDGDFEEQVAKITGGIGVTVKAVRQFVVKIVGQEL